MYYNSIIIKSHFYAKVLIYVTVHLNYDGSNNKKSRKHQRCNSRVASQNHLVKLDSCFQDLSMLCAKYQSSGITGSQEEDF